MILRARICGLFVSGVATAAAVCGCKSAASTHIVPDPTQCGGYKTKHLRGIPVTVTVPHQLQVQLIERRYIGPDGEPVMVDKVPVASILTDVKVLEKQVVFTVDAVRPAAGKLEYSAEFTKQQYFKNFNSKVEDTTIETISKSIDSLVGTIGKLPKAGAKSMLATSTEVNWTSVDNLIAVGHFDVYDPNLETAVREFLQTHLNNCAPPCTPSCPAKK